MWQTILEVLAKNLHLARRSHTVSTTEMKTELVASTAKQASLGGMESASTLRSLVA
jgi:hypothetical protein